MKPARVMAANCHQYCSGNFKPLKNYFWLRLIKAYEKRSNTAESNKANQAGFRLSLFNMFPYFPFLVVRLVKFKKSQTCADEVRPFRRSTKPNTFHPNSNQRAL